MGVAKNVPHIKEPAMALLEELNAPLEAVFSTLGRHAARALECRWAAQKMVQYVDDLTANIRAGDECAANMEKWEPGTWPKEARGVGFCEAPRGALGHWCVIRTRASPTGRPSCRRRGTRRRALPRASSAPSSRASSAPRSPSRTSRSKSSARSTASTRAWPAPLIS